MKFSIIRTGVANLASVKAALDRLSIESTIVNSPLDLEVSDAVVLPGVGAFDPGMECLIRNNWQQYLIQRFLNDEPTLAICLGMQLLCAHSEESSEQKGLGILPGNVVRFPAHVSVPQFGWNRVGVDGQFFESGYGYFANSFCIPFSDRFRQEGWEVLTAEHGIQFVAAVRKGNWLACQFHPELSGNFGARLLKTWIGRFANSVIDDPTEARPC